MLIVILPGLATFMVDLIYIGPLSTYLQLNEDIPLSYRVFNNINLRGQGSPTEMLYPWDVLRTMKWTEYD